MNAPEGRYTMPDDPMWGWEFTCEWFVFDRLAEDEQAAQDLPAPQRATALARLGELRQLAAEHSIYVDADGRNWGRCYTCTPMYGVPCATIRMLARLWPDHPQLPVAAVRGPREGSLTADAAAAGGWSALFLNRRRDTGRE